MIGTTPVGNAYEFSGTAFGWLCSRPISLLTVWSRPLSVLLNAERCKYLWRDLSLLLFTKERFSELPEDNSSSTRVSMLSWTMSFFLYREWSGALLGRNLAHIFCQDCSFLQPGPANGRFPAAYVQRDPTIPSFVLLALPVSSPCLDANEETDPRAIGSPGC